MTKIFDGKKFALKKEKILSIRVLGLKTRGVYPKLASILVGNDPASQLYVNMKKKAAERVGIEVDIYLIKENSKFDDLITLIETLNEDKSVNGIMVQMPIPGLLGEMKNMIVGTIKPEKDVDGLRNNSNFLHPTSKAVIDIMKLAIGGNNCKVAVIGATGMVGKPLVNKLKKDGYGVIECDDKTVDLASNIIQADVVISAAGVAGLIKENMIKKGVVVIDVGSPKGDFDMNVKSKASFFTPVPGGVGPVTISCLLENLINAC